MNKQEILNKLVAAIEKEESISTISADASEILINHVNDIMDKAHRVTVHIVNNSTNELPEYASILSSGMDVRANIKNINIKQLNEKSNSRYFYTIAELNQVVLEPGGRCLIPTGLQVAIPAGYEIQIRPRSGLAFKEGVTVLNSPGTIDADYRGDIGIILYNSGEAPVIITHGDRIAQLILAKVEQIVWRPRKTLPETTRNEGGFGHTGIK